MPRKYKWMRPRNLTVKCLACNTFSFVSRANWPSKRSGKPLACMHCGTYVPTREWSLKAVPWLRVAKVVV